MVQFLTECIQEGFKYNIIAGFRSAISAYYDPIQGIPLGKHPRVSDLLTGIFNKNHPQSKFNFIWDVKKVINYFSFQKFETNGNLKDLTLKLIVLLALTSVGRASDIAYLDTRYLIKHPSGYIFQFEKTLKLPLGS